MKVRKLLLKVPPQLRRDAELLLSHLLSVKPSQLPLVEEVPPSTAKRFAQLFKKLKKGTPLAYLIGEWECMGRVFKVEKGVLVPRPETELLIEKTLSLIEEGKPLTGLEIGVGSGCIAVNLLLERPLLKVAGVDVQEKALKVSAENARLHGVEERLTLLRGDLFTPVEGMRFDFIVSNPPYVPAKRWEELPPQVKAEGKTSLIGGESGLEFYERISKRAKEFLKEGGFVALEIGHDQGEAVAELFEKEGFTVNIFKDYSGADRIAIARWN